MSIFSRLFKKVQRRSQLEEFLSELTPSSIRSASLNGPDEGVRLATAMSLLVLAAAARFASRLAAYCEELSKKRGMSRAPTAGAFDVVCFEVAAFAHHTLLDPFMMHSDDFDQDESDEDPYFVVLRSAAHLSSSVLQKFTDFELHEDFFVNRVGSYSLPGRRTIAASVFESVLSRSIQGESPKAGLRGALSLNLSLTLALKVSIPAFCKNTIPALSVATRQVFENSDELGLVD